MKKLTALMGALIIILAVGAFGSRRFSRAELLESEYADTLRPCGVEMELRGSVDRNSLRVPLRFENTTGTQCSYDSARRLEVKLGGSWYIVPDSSPGVEQALSALPAGSGTDAELPLKGHYGSLPRGRYRVIKEFITSASLPLTACAEFQVK